MIHLKEKISDLEEVFYLKSRDFYRPPLKQMGNSIFKTKNYFTSRGAISVVPPDCCLTSEIKDDIIKLFQTDGLLTRRNILSSTPLPPSTCQGFIFLSHSFTFVLDLFVSRKPGNVEFDVFLASPYQPLIVLTFISGSVTEETHTYNVSVARGVTSALRRFTSDNVNVLNGVLRLGDLKDVAQLENKLLKIAEYSSVGVPKESLSMDPLKYDRTLTAFWAAVSETKTVFRGCDIEETECLHFLTTEQCTALVESSNMKVVHLRFLPGCGATTLMVEVARRLSRMDKTLLVCRSQLEADRFTSLYPDLAIASRMGSADLSSFVNVVGEVDANLGQVRGRLWRFQEVCEGSIGTKRKPITGLSARDIMKKRRRTPEVSRLKYVIIQIERKLEDETELSDEDHRDMAKLRHCLNISARKRDNLQKIIQIVSSDEKQGTLEYLFREVEIMKIFDICKLYSPVGEPKRLALQDIKGKQTKETIPPDLEADDQHSVINRLQHRIIERKDVFPALGDVIRQNQRKIANLHAKYDFLKQATSDQSFGKEIITKARRTEGEHTTKTLDLPNTGIPITDFEKIAKLKQDLDTMDMVEQHQELQLSELGDEIDHFPMWEHSTEYLSEQLESTDMQKVITDIFGEDDIPVPESNKSQVSLASHDVVKIRKGNSKQSRVRKITDFQQGKLTHSEIILILRNVTKDNQNDLFSLQTECNHLEQVYGCRVFMIGELDTSRSSPVSCPPMALNKERVIKILSVSEDGLKLVNRDESGRRPIMGQFQYFRGTCSSPIHLTSTPSSLAVPRYWETHTKVVVKREVSVWPILEMGICDEREVDIGNWIYEQLRSSWTICVIACRKHQDICTQVWREKKQVGDCHTNTLAATPGTDAVLRYGILLDACSAKLIFLDLNSERVLQRFVEEPRGYLFPMFGITPLSERCEVEMRLVSGKEIMMTDDKNHLLARALFPL